MFAHLHHSRRSSAQLLMRAEECTDVPRGCCCHTCFSVARPSFVGDWGEDSDRTGRAGGPQGRVVSGRCPARSVSGDAPHTVPGSQPRRAATTASSCLGTESEKNRGARLSFPT